MQRTWKFTEKNGKKTLKHVPKIGRFKMKLMKRKQGKGEDAK